MSARQSGLKARAARIALLALAFPLMSGALGRIDNWQDRVLSAHNRERATASVQPLIWDAKLAADARNWAGHLAATGRFDHAPVSADDPEPQGENLWAGTRGHYSAEAMVGMWSAERKDYRPGIFPHVTLSGDLSNVGHYTQLMWRATGRMGCALVAGKAEEFLVCRYSEGGNVIGERPF